MSAMRTTRSQAARMATVGATPAAPAAAPSALKAPNTTATATKTAGLDTPAAERRLVFQDLTNATAAPGPDAQQPTAKKPAAAAPAPAEPADAPPAAAEPDAADARSEATACSQDAVWGSSDESGEAREQLEAVTPLPAPRAAQGLAATASKALARQGAGPACAAPRTTIKRGAATPAFKAQAPSPAPTAAPPTAEAPTRSAAATKRVSISTPKEPKSATLARPVVRTPYPRLDPGAFSDEEDDEAEEEEEAALALAALLSASPAQGRRSSGCAGLEGLLSGEYSDEDGAPIGPVLLGGLGLDLEAATPAGADAPVFSPVVGALIAGELGGAVAPGSACTQARSVLLAQYGSEDEEEGDGVEQAPLAALDSLASAEALLAAAQARVDGMRRPEEPLSAAAGGEEAMDTEVMEEEEVEEEGAKPASAPAPAAPAPDAAPAAAVRPRLKSKVVVTEAYDARSLGQIRREIKEAALQKKAAAQAKEALAQVQSVTAVRATPLVAKAGAAVEADSEEDSEECAYDESAECQLAAALGGLGIAPAASRPQALRGVPLPQGAHIRFTDEGEEAPASPALVLRGVPKATGKHIRFD